MPSAAVREEILLSHLYEHRRHSLGREAVDQQLLQVRLLAALSRPSAWHSTQAFCFGRCLQLTFAGNFL